VSNTLHFTLHNSQKEIYNDQARFKVVAAGRRFGKTYLAVVMAIVEALTRENARGVELDDSSEVVYIGVTLEQARRNAWPIFKKLAEPVVKKDKNGRLMIHENTSVITLINGVRIRLLGMDNPDAARGMKLRFAIMDEYAQMPSDAWTEIIRPALIDCRGGALFIGTPKGRNHFFHLFQQGLSADYGAWQSFNYTSASNTFLNEQELVEVAEELTRGSSHLHAQEIQANFLHPGGDVFRREHFKIREDLPPEGVDYMAVDLAGFTTQAGTRNSEIKQRDETAIVVVRVFPIRDSSTDSANSWGWYIRDIKHGQWDVRTTAFQIVSTAKEYKVVEVGIEKGALQKAALPYIEDYMREYGYLSITELTHGNKHKYDRIRWALEGRCEKGRMFMRRADWNEPLLEQACGFPSKLVHDDLIDALAYVDQMAETSPFEFDTFDIDQAGFVPLDADAGY
jgi:hypothetical protein